AEQLTSCASKASGSAGASPCCSMPRWCERCWCRPPCGCWATGTGGRRVGSGERSDRGRCMRLARFLAVLAIAAGCSRPVEPLPAAPPPDAAPVQPIVFPRDAGPHDALTEWWYYTGHLRSERDGRAYGFEFVV